jgi:hypothetical protein
MLHKVMLFFVTLKTERAFSLQVILTQKRLVHHCSTVFPVNTINVSLYCGNCDSNQCIISHFQCNIINYARDLVVGGMHPRRFLLH